MMTRSDARPAAEAAAPGAPRGRSGRRAARVATPALSVIGSALVHAALVMAAAAVVWHTAAQRGPVPPDVTIDLRSPTFAEAARPGEAPAESPSASEARDEEPPVRDPSTAATLVLEDPGPVAGLPAPEPMESIAATLEKADAAGIVAESLGPAALDDRSLFSGDGGVMDQRSAASRAGGVTFAGLGASSARSVVYVVDCSGPMVTSLPMVLAEVQRSVNLLSPTQKFGVVLFRELETGPGVEPFAPLLVRATPSAKQRLREWLAGARPEGRSNPLDGLERGLAFEPDAIFLLSRSIERSGGSVWDQGIEATMRRLDELNPIDPCVKRRPVLIQTVQFLEEDPTGIMQTIGAQHGKPDGYRVARRGEDLEKP